ncbi:hypothetical protein FN846DRAFT_910145 [Sphaerosporella brunnea]|uniref:Uncharacterized protein n=1 Tax=Sphaerosporella brunnea TaxID=1250544 RepID=A0A5J5EN40_9PEZI|nr:hypothetical protein FN846DRAFT_910145 [Sphaerosporella brunnea]
MQPRARNRYIPWFWACLLHSADEVSPDGGLSLLLKMGKFEGKAIANDDMQTAREIFRRLGNFLLALTHAAAYMRDKQLTFTAYLPKSDQNFMETFSELAYTKGNPYSHGSFHFESYIPMWPVSYGSVLS